MWCLTPCLIIAFICCYIIFYILPSILLYTCFDLYPCFGSWLSQPVLCLGSASRHPLCRAAAEWTGSPDPGRDRQSQNCWGWGKWKNFGTLSAGCATTRFINIYQLWGVVCKLHVWDPLQEHIWQDSQQPYSQVPKSLPPWRVTPAECPSQSPRSKCCQSLERVPLATPCNGAMDWERPGNSWLVKTG